MKIIKQLIAGAAMATVSAIASAQPTTTMGNDSPVLTRAKVQAATAAAIAAGQMMPTGEVQNYPFWSPHTASTRSRVEVEGEAAAAVAAGKIPRGELSLADMQRQPATSQTTRAQVRAETLEAGRLGLLRSAGELAPPQATLMQVEAIRATGLRAHEAGPALASR